MLKTVYVYIFCIYIYILIFRQLAQHTATATRYTRALMLSDEFYLSLSAR